ncbi:glycosyltransferase [Paradevosia shaoguanensis]|uniref:glycosyltransferase n=1 Tax=Paradevosia shaoguanensis TaxID=1335043 RepID=UPI001933DDBE|nr:glycosyltransferase [Paradevosia shaoguanensis]
MLRILYLVPSLADPAVARRVAMLRLGGAEVEIAGFRRADAPPDSLPAGTVVELDVTHDGRMLQRLFATLTAAFRARGWARSFARPDVIIARNLEMLGIANRLLGFWPQPPALVYECLDIHRLMLRQDNLGRSMRLVEQRLSRSAALLLTSSPAFLENYFAQHGSPPPYLIENKVFAPEGLDIGDNPALRGDIEPIRIGWFGALRCHKSLTALDAASRALDGRVEVTLRGRPALTEFEDFAATTEAAPHLRYAGPYRYPHDLAAIYSDVHFVWAIDFFEEGQNSRWLLPNRIYEGCLNGAIPIALAGTETAAFIERLGIGLVIPDIEIETLKALFSALTSERLLALAQAVRAQDPVSFRCEKTECDALVDRLADLAPASLEKAA